MSEKGFHDIVMVGKQDEWVISRVFKKTGSGNGAAMHGGAMKKTARPNPEPSSPSSVSLPPLLDSSPYTSAAADATVSSAAYADGDDTREHELHVTCFSTNNLNYCSSASAFPSFQENLQAPFLISPVGPSLVHLVAGAANLDGCGGGPTPEGSADVNASGYMWRF